MRETETFRGSAENPAHPVPKQDLRTAHPKGVIPREELVLRNGKTGRKEHERREIG
jgi:hypothetical protein